MKHSFLFLVNRYLTSSFMVRSRALPITLPGEKNKQKTNKQNDKTFHSALYIIYLLCALCVCFVVLAYAVAPPSTIFGTLIYFFVSLFQVFFWCVPLFFIYFLLIPCFIFLSLVLHFSFAPRFGWRVATSSFWRRRGERIGTSESVSATSFLAFCGCLALKLSHQPPVLILCNKPLKLHFSKFTC